MISSGTDAESLACQHLEQHSLKLLLRNYRTRRGELDLVMLDGQTLVIVEVRRRSHAAYGGALASVDARKRRRIILATRLLLLQRPDWAARAVRFDVIAFEATGKLQWVRGAFDAGGY